MAAAWELRAEAARMWEFARTVTAPEVLAEINALIEGAPGAGTERWLGQVERASAVR